MQYAWWRFRPRDWVCRDKYTSCALLKGPWIIGANFISLTYTMLYHEQHHRKWGSNFPYSCQGCPHHLSCYLDVIINISLVVARWRLASLYIPAILIVGCDYHSCTSSPNRTRSVSGYDLLRTMRTCSIGSQPYWLVLYAGTTRTTDNRREKAT